MNAFIIGAIAFCERIETHMAFERVADPLPPKMRVPICPLPFALAWAKLKLRFGVAWRGGDVRANLSLPLKGGGPGWGSEACEGSDSIRS